MIPGAKVVIAETGHLIQEEDPELVIEEITQVVEQARSR
jgi:pimeloyl-ACP methyl ester carboxylesterase